MGIFWDRPAEEVGRDLVGRILLVRELRAVVQDADCFTREENSAGTYAAMLTMAPGSVYCVKVMGHVMLLLVTRDGSCVRIKSAQINGERCPKPGVVTRALGLVTNKQRGAVRAVDDRTFRLDLEGT